MDLVYLKLDPQNDHFKILKPVNQQAKKSDYTGRRNPPWFSRRVATTSWAPGGVIWNSGVHWLSLGTSMSRDSHKQAAAASTDWQETGNQGLSPLGITARLHTVLGESQGSLDWKQEQGDDYPVMASGQSSALGTELTALTLLSRSFLLDSKQL